VIVLSDYAELVLRIAVSGVRLLLKEGSVNALVSSAASGLLSTTERCCDD
jgi:hypothetical protein